LHCPPGASFFGGELRAVLADLTVVQQCGAAHRSVARQGAHSIFYSIFSAAMTTDSQLQQDVIAALKSEPRVHAAQIGVAVRNGQVSLSGQVGSYLERCEAETAVLRVEGVKSLVAGLELKLPRWDRHADADPARIAPAKRKSLQTGARTCR
jgi:hypothetical protein